MYSTIPPSSSFFQGLNSPPYKTWSIHKKCMQPEKKKKKKKKRKKSRNEGDTAIQTVTSRETRACKQKKKESKEGREAHREDGFITGLLKFLDMRTLQLQIVIFDN
jgi:hypothetical protein